MLLSKVCTYCSIHRVSPCGDPNLSPGGLRVPARVRSFILIFARRVAATTVGAFTGRDNAVNDREDAILEGGSFGLEVYHRIQPGRVGKGSTLPYSTILVQSETIILSRSFRASVLSWGSRSASRESFQRSAISEKLSGFFWVLCGEAIPRVSQFSKEGSSPK